MRERTETVTVEGIPVTVVRKRVKNLNLTVRGRDGRVRLSAPLRASEKEIMAMLTERLPWIRKHRDRLLSDPLRRPLQATDGEQLWFWDRPYRLRLTPGTRLQAALSPADATVRLSAPPDAPAAARLAALDRLWRREIRAKLAELAPAWEAHMGAAPRRYVIKKMTSRWGSCSRQTGTIALNLELAKRDEGLLAYVLVHELAHLTVPNHGPDFQALMSRYLPDWKARRQALNAIPITPPTPETYNEGS